MNKEEKTAVVAELTDELKQADAIFAIDYRGISVPQAAELRSGLRDANARFRIVKNRLTLRAADAAGTETLKEHLEGPTALTLVEGDVALAAKTIRKLGDEWELLTYKGGLMEGEPLDADSFVAIAKLPGRDQLNAQFAGVVASPLTGLVRGLGSMVQGLASQLQQIADQGLVSGEPPAETPKEVEASAAGGDETASEDAGAAAEDASSDGEADAPTAEESEPDPEPAESPEESSEEQAPEGEDAGEVVDETGEGDAKIGEAQEDKTDKEDDAPAAADAEEASGEEAGGGEDASSNDDKEDE